ncbi:hypothetical protein R1sor_019099 [Riccia sorocarpa]|uniref:Uncharacterized protein n=1 Tax=Riccia sorocarpa TaxID=122646 RepID=A0ABD3IEA5_9MARC
MGVEGEGPTVASAVIVLGTEDRLSASVGQECGKLSAALVQLKGECMKFLGDYLIRKNTPLEEPDEVLEESLSDDEDDGDLLGDVAGKKDNKSKARN